MNQKQALLEALEKHLGPSDLDVIEVLPLPRRGDRMVRVQTLEEALAEFESNDDCDTVSYLVQVKRKRDPSCQEPAPSDPFGRACAIARGEELPPPRPGVMSPGKPSLDGIYLPNGRLNLPFLHNNAETLFKAGEYALARNIYRTILSSGESSAQAHYWLGRCYEAEDRDDEAARHYEESITYHPSLDCHRRLANLLIGARKDQRAAELLEAALNLKNLSSAERLEIHQAAGNCWLRAEKPDKAENHYQQALENEPLADGVHANLGALYLEAGKTPEAKRHFQEALAINGRNDRALAGLGSCHLAEGDKRSAHDCFAKSLQVNLNNPTVIYYLVKCAYEIKSYATAANLVSDYIQIAPVNTSLLYSLAGLQYHLGRMPEARETAERILSLQPQHTGATELLKTINRFTGS